MTWHPAPSPSIQNDLRLIVDRNVEAVVQALSRLQVDEPAFALCLWASDEPELCASHISVGLDRDRQGFLNEGNPWEVATETWIGDGVYTHDNVEVPDPRSDPTFLVAEERVNAWLDDAEVEEPSRWAMEEIAYRMTREPPPIPLTEDFVAFVYDRAAGDLMSSLRWVVPDDKHKLLEQKGMLVSDIDSLRGAPPEH